MTRQTVQAPEENLFDNLWTLMRVMRGVRGKLGAQSAQPGTLTLLGEIARADAEGRPCRGKELVDASGLDVSTVSRAVTHLVDRGLVARTVRQADRRSLMLTPTPAGLATLAGIRAIQQQLLTDARQEWTAEERATFDALLARFIGDLEHVLDLTPPD